MAVTMTVVWPTVKWNLEPVLQIALKKRIWRTETSADETSTAGDELRGKRETRGEFELTHVRRRPFVEATLDHASGR